MTIQPSNPWTFVPCDAEPKQKCSARVIAAQQGVNRIKQLNIRLGELSAMTRALHFCFGSASQGTSCEGAILNIEDIRLTVFCDTCDSVKTPSGRYSFRCPDCGMPTPTVVADSFIISR